MKKIIFPGQEDARIGAWVGSRLDIDDWGKFKAFGVEKDGQLIAGVIFNHFRMPSISMHVAGEGKYWMSRELLKHVFTYAFDMCRCTRINTLVRADAESVIRFDDKIGFIREGVVRKGAMDGTDMILLGMLREECKYIDR
jgi:RimJ/RimL family protein N-acetyltransferase